jgi:bifunctional NMN adenylyltransferase/nudix hydrolase
MASETVVGVVIARFQVPKLHEGHRHLVDHVIANHKRVIVLLGDRDIQRNDKHSLDFATRKLMVNGAYPEIECYRLLDKGNDELWSEEVDSLLANQNANDAVLYGSRDSFIPHYLGAHRVVEVPAVSLVNGTGVREKNAKKPLDSEDFRRGVLYAMSNRYPQGHPAVDCALVRRRNDEFEILLGKKDRREKSWRFIGGFFDPEKDTSYEEAAMRELREEGGPGLVFDYPNYIGSAVINDWRYRDSKDRIVTALMLMWYLNGEIKAGDDMAEVAWIPLSRLMKVVYEHHQPLAVKVSQFLER